MDELFEIEPIRPPARRGVRTVPMRRPKPDDLWPRRDRDPADVAILANRVLVLGARFDGRLRRVARRHGVDPYVVRLLLLFAESNRPLRIGNIAELLGPLPYMHSTSANAGWRAGVSAGMPDE
jgi:hypothetical protein